MKNTPATGTQIAILIFAITFLAVPVARIVAGPLAGSPWDDPVIGRGIPFVLGALIVVAFPALRRIAARELGAAIPDGRGKEAALVTALHVLQAFAFAGGYVLWAYMSGGPGAIEQKLAALPADAADRAATTSAPGIVHALIIGVVIAPVMEELAFRAFLFRAWERQWGWIPAMLASSAIFALYHHNFWAAFPAAILLTCVYRRTGSLRSSIVVHATYNLLIWYPLLGQFVFPRHLAAPGDLPSWSLQLAALALVLVALPAYVYMSRDARAHAEVLPDGALPR